MKLMNMAGLMGMSSLANANQSIPPSESFKRVKLHGEEYFRNTKMFGATYKRNFTDSLESTPAEKTTITKYMPSEK